MTASPLCLRPLAAVLVAVFCASCVLGVGRAPLPPDPPTINVDMREFRFVYKQSIPQGRVVFKVRNSGRLHHALTLVALPKDAPPLGTPNEVASQDPARRRVVNIVFLLSARAPGSPATAFALDLAPGRYGMICSVRDAEGKEHAEQGMTSEFQVP